MVQRHIFIDIVGQLALVAMGMGAVRGLAQVLGIKSIHGIGGEDGRREGGREDAIIPNHQGGAHRGVHVMHAIRRDGDITQRLAGCPLPQILDGSGLEMGEKRVN